MVTYSKKGKRHFIGLNDNDVADLTELIWVLKHTPPPIGFNRKPLTHNQQRIIESLYNVIYYPPDYGEIISKKMKHDK